MDAKQLWTKCVDDGMKIVNNVIEFSPPMKIKLKDNSIKLISGVTKIDNKFLLVEFKPKFNGRLTTLC